MTNYSNSLYNPLDYNTQNQYYFINGAYYMIYNGQYVPVNNNMMMMGMNYGSNDQ